jgi:MFS family permease
MKMFKFFWSWSLDIYSTRKVFGLLLFMQFALNFTVIFAVHNVYTYAVWIWLFIFVDGGLTVMIPNILKKTFGSKATALSGFFYSYLAVYALLTLGLFIRFLHQTPGSYNAFFLFNGTLSITAFLLLYFFMTDKVYMPKSLKPSASMDIEKEREREEKQSGYLRLDGSISPRIRV